MEKRKRAGQVLHNSSLLEKTKPVCVCHNKLITKTVAKLLTIRLLVIAEKQWCLADLAVIGEENVDVDSNLFGHVKSKCHISQNHTVHRDK